MKYLHISTKAAILMAVLVGFHIDGLRADEENRARRRSEMREAHKEALTLFAAKFAFARDAVRNNRAIEFCVFLIEDGRLLSDVSLAFPQSDLAGREWMSATSNHDVRIMLRIDNAEVKGEVLHLEGKLDVHSDSALKNISHTSTIALAPNTPTIISMTRTRDPHDANLSRAVIAVWIVPDSLQ